MFWRTAVSSFRRFRRQKGYGFLNLLGLAVGLAASFFILLWVQDELRVDRFHADGDRLYRVMRNSYYTDAPTFTTSAIPQPLAQSLRDDYPEIADVALMSWENETLMSHANQTFRESGRFVGPSWFRMFSYRLVAGDENTLLDDPESVAISESLAQKYFGATWQSTALGQSIRIDNRYDATITGIFEDVTSASSIQFDFVIPVEEYVRRNDWVPEWGNNALWLFVRLADGSDADAVSDKIRDVVADHLDSDVRTELFLRPAGDMYLYSDFEEGRVAGGRIEYVRILSVVAAFLLIIACINFMNLATARSAKRAREIGVRKAIGATQGTLMRQFLGESVLTALVAFVLACILVVAGLSGFNGLTGKSLTLADLGGTTWLWFLMIATGTGLLAGIYPALYLSSFNVVTVLKKGSVQRRGTVGLRKGLVVFQFALSILLLVTTLTVYRQIDYIRSKNLGLERENVVTATIEGTALDQFDSFKQTLLSRPGIASVSAAQQNPLSVGHSTTSPSWDGEDPDANILFYILSVQYDFVETMRMDVLDGRPFDQAFGTDTLNFLVNEAAARIMGMDDPVGERLSMWEYEGQIVGLVRDFHMTTMYNPIEPTIIRLDRNVPAELFVRTEPGQTQEAISGLEQVYAEFNPGLPFVYDFLDSEYERMYESEATIGRLANVFSGLAIFIACLGLFGLAAYGAEQRTKELGIRRVLGASVRNLVMLLSKEFVALVAVAFVLTIPVAYYVANSWLQDFTYHTSLSWSVFVASGVGAMLVAWITVSFQSYKAALANPTTSLRTE